jgi:hypothetical protein
MVWSLAGRAAADPSAPDHLDVLRPALVADRAGLDPVYCVICDADLSRVWVASKVAESRIRYWRRAAA